MPRGDAQRLALQRLRGTPATYGRVVHLQELITGALTLGGGVGASGHPAVGRRGGAVGVVSSSRGGWRWRQGGDQVVDDVGGP
jgi:hypothetical protein